MPSGTHHATPSCATFEVLIELATSRVFARLAPGSAQAAAAAGLREPPGALFVLPAAQCPATQLATVELPPLPQPPAARPAAASTLTLAAPVRITKRLIEFVLLPRQTFAAPTLRCPFPQAAGRLPGPQRQVRPPGQVRGRGRLTPFPARAMAGVKSPTPPRPDLRGVRTGRGEQRAA